MQNLQPSCLKPATILNPHLKDLVLKFRHYYYRGKKHWLTLHRAQKWYDEFPYTYFSKLKKSLLSDVTPDFDSCYILDENHEPIPLFMQVPCGKCVLCTEKKAQEWVSRAMCESQTSVTPPWFITLTYNDLHRPLHGVNKDDAQRFMKRFRINLERYCKKEVNIRFFLCSEYGSKTGRPHYHALIWNIPLLEHTHLLEILEQSWSRVVSKQDFDELPNTYDKYHLPIYKFYDKRNRRYRARIGYVTASQCNEKRCRYCMKYMRKECTPPTNANDVFFLSSRRRGLGYEWMVQHLEEYRKNPSFLDIQLTDKWTGETYKGCIPQYFKNLISPTDGLLIKKAVRDTFKLYTHIISSLKASGYVLDYNTEILQMYPTLPVHDLATDEMPQDLHRLYDETIKIYHPTYWKYIDMENGQPTAKDGLIPIMPITYYPSPDSVEDIQNHILSEKLFILFQLEQVLLQYRYDIDQALATPVYKKAKLSYVEQLANRMTESPQDKAHRIKYRRQLSQQREQL